MAEWDTAELLEDVKQRGSLPDNDVRFTAAVLLAAATRELREGVAPILVETRAEHLVYEYEVDVVAGQAEYRMPPRAIGGALRDVVWVGSDGVAQPPLRQLSSDEAMAQTINQATPGAYFLRNYSVVLVPPPNVAGTLRMPYYARPNRLVLPAAVATLSDVTPLSGGGYRLTSPTGEVVLDIFNSLSAELVKASPGFESEVLLLSNPETAGSDERVEVAPARLVPEVGDFLCIPGEAPVPQIPVELHGLLAVRTARRALKAVGDDRWQALEDDVRELEARVRSILTPRVAGDTQQAGGSIGSSGIVAIGGGWRL